jgi:hypothetical protein
VVTHLANPEFLGVRFTTNVKLIFEEYVENAVFEKKQKISHSKKIAPCISSGAT